MQSSDSDAPYPSEYSVSSARQSAAARLAAQQQAEKAAAAAFEYERIREQHGGAYPNSSYPPLTQSQHYSEIPGTPVRQGIIAPPTGADEDPEAAAMHQLHHLAIRQWRWRVTLCFALHMITALCLLHSYYWFTTVIGVVLLIAIFVFAFSIKMRQTTFVLLYLLVVLLNLGKNIIILYFYFQTQRQHKEELTSYDLFLIALLLADVALLTPFSFYSCFYLHRSISLTHLTF